MKTITKGNTINFSSVNPFKIKNFDQKPLKGGMPAIEKTKIIKIKVQTGALMNHPDKFEKNKALRGIALNEYILD